MPGARNTERWSWEAGRDAGNHLVNDALDVVLLASVLLTVALLTVL
jgi:hypothetical protein